MAQIHYSDRGAVVASVWAGPIYVTAIAIGAYIQEIPRPVPFDPGEAAASALIVVPAMMVGFVLAIFPNLLGGSVMARVSESFAAARAPEAWVGVGAAAGYAIALPFSLPALPWTFALVATSAVCAGICRSHLRVD